MKRMRRSAILAHMHAAGRGKPRPYGYVRTSGWLVGEGLAPPGKERTL